MKTTKKFTESLADDKVYFADKTHVSCSMLKNLLKSPADFRAYLDSPPEATPAMTFGSAFHCMALEPHKFNDQFYILDTELRPEKEKGMTSTINKKWKMVELSHAQSVGKSIISVKDLDKIDAMCMSLFHHPKVMELISQAEKEQAVTWTTDKGIKCKGKLDLKSFDFIADIKTTAEFGGLDKFKYDCKKYHYDMQAAFYSDAVGLDQFKFIVIGKNFPYNVGIFDVSPEFLESGRQKYKYTLEMYDKYFVSCTEEIDSYIEEGTL